MLEPGESPEENLQFLFFCTAVVRGVERHQDLLRASVAFAGNDHRLGANEAPPAIISVFLGEQLAEIFEHLARAEKVKSKRNGGLLGLGTPVLPRLPQHVGDRNRTSSFAFTGTVRVRAPGASQSIVPVTLNTIRPSRSTWRPSWRRSSRADATEGAMRALLARIRDPADHLNGDGSEDWQAEAGAGGCSTSPTRWCDRAAHG